MPGRIGFVTTSFPRTKDDYAGNFVFHMAEAFSSLGYQIDVIVPSPPPNQPTTWLHQTEWPHWLRIFPVSYMWPPGLQQLFFSEGTPENLQNAPWKHCLIVPATLKLWHQIQRLAPSWDAVVSHWLVPSALISPRVSPFCHSNGNHLPHLGIAHSGDIHLLKQLPTGRLLAATIARRCTALGFVSNQLLNEFDALLPQHHDGHHKLHHTPMGIFDDKKSQTYDPPSAEGIFDKKHTCAANPFTVLYLGRLSPIKGIENLITAAEQGGFELIIAGDGALRNDLEQQCKNQNVDATFTGVVTPVQREQLFKQAHALAVPSIPLENGRHEGTPMILLEAMNAGLPIVASNSGGIAELINSEQNGLLVPPGDSNALCNALVQLRDLPQRREHIIRAALQTARQRRWHVLIPKYRDILFQQ